MDSISIEKILSTFKLTKNNFCGVYACNQLPKRIKKGCFIIVNSDPSYMAGQHWFAIYFKNNTCYFFDTFGRKPQNKFIIEFIKNNSNILKYNSTKIQNIYSINCGIYCILFITFISKGFNPDFFIQLFCKDTHYNEKLIETLYKKIFK